MPFAFDLLDEEQKKQAEQAQGGAAPAMTGGGETFGGSGGSAGLKQSDQQQKGTAKQGSGFVGLDKYMSANKGNNFGGQFTGKVQGAVDTAKQGLNQGAQDFTQAANQGGPRWNDVQDQVKGIVDNAGDQTSKDDVGKIQGLAAAKYQGPESFFGSAYGAKALGDVQKAGQQANAAQTEGGRFALLDQYFGRPKYTLGEKSLDNLLVQNTPGVAARAQAVNGQAKSLSNDLNQKAQDLDNLAAGNKQAVIDTGAQTRGYLKNAQSGFADSLNKRYSDYNSANNDYNISRVSDIGDDALDADTLGLYGLGGGEGLYDTNFGSYMHESPQASLGEFASDQDYSKYLALSQLAGEDPTLLSADNRAKAGTGNNMGKVTVDKDQFQKDLAERGKTYADHAKPLQDSIAKAQAEASDLQTIFDRHYASLPWGQDVTKDSPERIENNMTAAIRNQLNAKKAELNSYQSQLNSLNAAMKPNRKVGKA